MNFQRGFLQFINVWAKMEIVGGLILIVLLLGYLGVENRSDPAPSVQNDLPVIQK